MLAQRTDQFNRSAINSRSELMNASALILCADLLMVPAGLLTVAMITRWLGPEDYGLFALCASLVTGLEWGLASILSRPTIHGVGHVLDWRPVARKLLSWHLIIATAVMLTLWIMARPIAGLLREPTLIPYLALFACDLPFFLWAQAYRNILTGREQFGARALAGASRWLARLALIAIAVKLGLTIPAAILCSIGASIIELAVGRWSLGPIGPGGSADVTALKRLALPLVVSAVAITLVSKMDLFLIKTLGLSAAEAGFYAAAQNLTILPGIFGQAVSAVILSALTRMKMEGQMAIFRRTAEQSLQASLGLLPLAGLIAGAASGIAVLCFGPVFEGAAPFVSILMIGAVAQVLIGMLMAILIADGYIYWTVALASPLVLLAIGGHLWSIPEWGPIGAAWTTSGTMFVGALAGYIAVRSLCAVRLRVGSVVPALLLAGLGFGLSTLGPAGTTWLLIGLPVIGVLLVAIYGWWAGLLTRGNLIDSWHHKVWSDRKTT